MSQSGTLIAFLLAAFLFYLAAKGRLTTYTGVLWGPKTTPAKSSAPASGSGGGGDIIGDIIHGAELAIPFILG